jgi:L-ascorbate metabolism protein UlaG (beta-lactamase superfamily)
VHAASAVLIGHTHFDRVIDAPLIAQRFGCSVYGSRSLAALMAVHGLAAQAVPSVHSRLLLGLSVPFDHDISCAHLDELAPSAYGCGDVHGIFIRAGGVSLYHQGSADLIDDALRHRGVDYFLMGIAGRGFARRYVERAVRTLEPRVIVPHHYDDFMRPLDAPMGFSLNVNVAGFMDEVAAVSRSIEIRTLTPMQTIGTSRR